MNSLQMYYIWGIGFIAGFIVGGIVAWWAAWKIALYIERKRIAKDLANVITKGVAQSMADPAMKKWAAAERAKILKASDADTKISAENVVKH